MNIQNLGAIGEFIGAISVLLTLIYLSLQIKAQNAIAKADGHRDLIKQVASLHRRIDERKSAEILVRGSLDLSSLTTAEKIQFDSFFYEYIHICEQVFYMGRDKYVPAGSYDAFMFAAASFISSPGARQWWEVSRVGGYAADFVQIIEEMRDGKTEIPPPWLILPPLRYAYDDLQSKGNI